MARNSYLAGLTLRVYFNEEADNEGNIVFTIFSADAATAIADSSLKAIPFFNCNDPVPSLLQAPTDPAGQGSLYATANRNRMLAEMIPALSFATGRNNLGLLQGNNFDMDHMKNGWPANRSVPNLPAGHDSNPWIHGDHAAVAYFYVYQVFDKIVKSPPAGLGGFDQ